MTPHPCFDEKTRTDCPRRYVGCKADCARWQEWLIVHAEEKAEIQRKKHHDNDVNTFLMGQGLRQRRGNQAKNEQERRRRG